MSLFNKLEQNQSLKLNISNKLVQSLKILNMGRQELEDAIESESMTNPVLEVEIENNEVNWESYFKKELNELKMDKNDIIYSDSSEYDFENMTRDEDSLYDTLHGQINIMKISDEHKFICHYLIDSLDKDGYLREEEYEISEKLKVGIDNVEACIRIVQSLEPAGICARSLQECLIIQLRSMGIYDKVLEDIINDDINLIANSNIASIASHYKIKKEKVKEYIMLIRTLEPKPVEQYSKSSILYAYPDVIIEKVDGKSVAKPYHEKKIHLGIDNYYKDLFLKTDDETVKTYIREKLNSAKKLMNDISERNSTVVNIANAIIEMQSEFFDYGGKLKPMTQYDISEKIGCHISTVSRGINDKYMLTSKGLFELKSFFSNSYEMDDGEVISSITVKDEIKKIIDGEDKSRPLSDKKIEDMLNEKGFDIARRTVAKYREELGYLSSSKRKKIL